MTRALMYLILSCLTAPQTLAVDYMLEEQFHEEECDSTRQQRGQSGSLK